MNKLCARLLRAPATFNQYSSCVALGRNLSSYKSDLSLDVLYPQSQHVQFYTPPAPVCCFVPVITCVNALC